MSGHSKWSTIKHKKAINDQQRSKIFSKMSRLITIAVHEGGGIPDIEKNFKLRLIVERAKSENMSKETIQRAIDKAVGGEGSMMKEVMYEAFGPGGSMLLISATTDNPNRTYPDVKLALDRNGGKIGGQNSVAHMFEKSAVVVFDKEGITEEQVFEYADTLGALDMEVHDTEYVIFIPFANIGTIKDMNMVVKPRDVDVYYKPQMPATLSPEDEEKMQTLVSALEELDDVQAVYINL